MYPKDKNGKEFQVGDIFQEGIMGKRIWDGKGSIWYPALGIFTGEKVEYPVEDGWVVKDYMHGTAFDLTNGSMIDLYTTRYDGEYVGDWENTLIVGTITGDKEACAQFLGANWKKVEKNMDSLKESFKEIGDEVTKAKEAMLKMCEAMMEKVEEMTPEEAAKLVEECGLVYYAD